MRADFLAGDITIVDRLPKFVLYLIQRRQRHGEEIGDVSVSSSTKALSNRSSCGSRGVSEFVAEIPILVECRP